MDEMQQAISNNLFESQPVSARPTAERRPPSPPVSGLLKTFSLYVEVLEAVECPGNTLDGKAKDIGHRTNQKCITTC